MEYHKIVIVAKYFSECLRVIQAVFLWPTSTANVVVGVEIDQLMAIFAFCYRTMLSTVWLSRNVTLTDGAVVRVPNHISLMKQKGRNVK